MEESAQPRARLGADFSLPIVYAGNVDARKNIGKILGEKYALEIVDNIRPVLEVENVDPAREAIHQCFMEHVMSHAPGYPKLMKWTNVPIMPTPMGEGTMITTLARLRRLNVVGVGLGGATTNVYSVYDGKFVRTVSANLGMSYSIGNVLKEAGIGNIMRWIPFEVTEEDLRNILCNKMIRPTTIPQTINELIIEHAVAREALRLGFTHHKFLARGLRGIKKEVSLEFLDQTMGLESYIDLLRVAMIVGTGGLLSHAPRRVQAALMLIDGFQPEGVTRLAQDSVFMMPHLGVLSTVNQKAAVEVFEKDCLIMLGTCIAPKGPFKEGTVAATLNGKLPNGTTLTEEIRFGEIKTIPLKRGEFVDADIRPHKDCDVGATPGHILNTTIEGGEVGIILDGRGRPLTLPETATEMHTKLMQWLSSLQAYPTETLEKMGGD